MMISLLLALVIAEPQQQVEQQLQRQQQQIDQIRQQLQHDGQTLRRMSDLLERQDQRALCTAEMRWVNGGDKRKVPAGSLTAVPVNLFSIVSKPSGGCLPAEIRVTASYVDAGDNLICSGVIENLAIQNSLTQSVSLEIRPWNLREFARWRNEPPQVNSGPRRLICMNLEGTAEATSEELARILSVRVRATVLPLNGGMSTAEIEFSLR